MGYANDKGELVDEDLGRLKPGEPFFVLRGQDLFGAFAVGCWIMALEQWFRILGTEPNAQARAKLDKARKIQAAMKAWRPQKTPD